MVTAFGVAALTFMMLMYALEQRNERFVLRVRPGLSALERLRFLAGTWPFGVVELIWAGIAVRRYMSFGQRDRPTAA